MWSIRKTPERVRRVEALAAAIMEDPANITKIIDYALSFTIAANATLPTAHAQDRRQDPPGLSMVQALTLADVAEDIAGKTYTGTQPTDAERLQLYEQLTPMPAWYTDEHRENVVALVKHIRSDTEKGE